MKKILSTMRHAIDKYNLIEDGDKIAIGVSGGKDSLVMLKAMAMYKKFSKQKYEVVAITIDMFNNPSHFEKVAKLCDELEIAYYIVPSDIYDIVFNIRKEKNPCSLCSKLRRGMLNTKALELGCNKLALAHSLDDLTHTFLLSLFYEGRMSTLSPKSYMTRTKMTVIRPLILTEESAIIASSKTLPVTKSGCPADKHTQREHIKQVLSMIQSEFPDALDRINSALTHPERNNLLLTDAYYMGDTFIKNAIQKENEKNKNK